MICRIEVDEQVDIALVIESICKDRPEDCQRLYLVFTAEVDDALQIKFD